MGENTIDTQLNQGVNGSELVCRIDGVKCHVESDTELTTAHLARALGNLDQALRRLLIEHEPTALARFEAPERHAVDTVGGRHANVGLHGLELRLRIYKVATARTDHATDLGAIVFARQGNGLLYHTERRGRAADGEIVAKLDTACARVKCSGNVGKVLGTILEQHGMAPCGFPMFRSQNSATDVRDARHLTRGAIE